MDREDLIWEAMHYDWCVKYVWAENASYPPEISFKDFCEAHRKEYESKQVVVK